MNLRSSLPGRQSLLPSPSLRKSPRLCVQLKNTVAETPASGSRTVKPQSEETPTRSRTVRPQSEETPGRSRTIKPTEKSSRSVQLPIRKSPRVCVQLKNAAATPAFRSRTVLPKGEEKPTRSRTSVKSTPARSRTSFASKSTEKPSRSRTVKPTEKPSRSVQLPIRKSPRVCVQSKNAAVKRPARSRTSVEFKSAEKSTKKKSSTVVSVKRSKSKEKKNDNIDTKKATRNEPQGNDEYDGENVYGVDEIVEHRKASEINFAEWNQVWNGSMDDLAFLVKWTGFDSKENTWEPLENVIMCEKFENYLNKYLVPTIGKRRRGRKENISFEFIEPKAKHCYYLKDLRGSDESFVRLDDSDVQDDDEFVPPPPKKAKLNKKYAAIRSPKVVIPKRPKKNVESNAASFALHNLLNDDNFVYNDGNVDAPVADETADFFGGAPDVEDMLLEPHVFQADIILGNFDTPTIPKKKQPAPPKKKEKPTKSIIPPASGRVTRSRTFAATPSAPETVEEAADIFGGAPDVEDMILEPHVFDSDNIPGNFDYYADDADENTYFFGGAPDVGDMIYDPHVFGADNILGNFDHYAPAVDETADFFGGAPDLGDISFEPHLFDADITLSNFDF